MGLKIFKPATISVKEDLITYNIHINGIVQGVGFRPYVYRTAIYFGLKGFVRNDSNGVFIKASGERNILKEFYLFLLHNAPKEANIVFHTVNESVYTIFDSFSIKKSESDNRHLTPPFITPDFAMCDKCKAELHDPSNRRFAYPFITCTDCGPRYSILQSLPFDRENTSMTHFKLCKTCNDEFLLSADRRFYSQTNSCKECGIKTILCDNSGRIISDQDAIILNKVSEFVNKGSIVAVKGIGGFLLICDATNREAVLKLRERKCRPTKPFAVIYPQIESIERDYFVNRYERELLTGEAAPIVLLQQKKNDCGIASDVIAPHLNKIGVFLPYAPLLELILSELKKPIVATSGNISGSSLIYTNESALEQLTTIADYILVHNRDITMPQDDSVIQISNETKTKIILRTGRGLSPVYFSIDDTPLDAIGYGALLKSSICLASSNQIYVSQYLGDTNDFDSQENYKEIAGRLCHILRKNPSILSCDAHPNYYSTRFSEQESVERQLPLIKIQHHKAHFFAILGEYRLLHEKVLGVIWDGTGLGEDGNIWGGEFFVYENYNIRRQVHFEYVTNILGDKMPKEPRLAALSFFDDVPNTIIPTLFNFREWSLLNNILSREKLKTSSVGRLFDAVAALLQLSKVQSYEGEAAMFLEKIAADYRKKHNSYYGVYNFRIIDAALSIKQMLSDMIADVENNEDLGKIGLKFHFTLVSIIAKVALTCGISKIAFSGGVFQNALLVDLIKLKMSNDYELYFHQKISPNDENISFGQIVALKCKQYST